MRGRIWNQREVAGIAKACEAQVIELRKEPDLVKLFQEGLRACNVNLNGSVQVKGGCTQLQKTTSSSSSYWPAPLGPTRKG